MVATFRQDVFKTGTFESKLVWLKAQISKEAWGGNQLTNKPASADM